MTLAIVLTSLLAYLIVGFYLGKRDLPRFIEHQRRQWPHSYGTTDFELAYPSPDTPDRTKNVYPLAAVWLIGWITLWPFWATCILAKKVLVKQVERVDPKANQAQIIAMQKRIDELESELGMQS